MLELFKKLPLWLRLWIIFPLTFLNGWLLLLLFNYLQPLSSLLLTAIILAFLLNFPIEFLQQRGVCRSWAISFVLAFALLLLGFLGLILVPLIVTQLSRLIASLPELINSGSPQLERLQQWASTQRLRVNLGSIVDPAITQLSDIVQLTSNKLLNFAVGTISSLFYSLLLLVLTIFMILSGESVWNGIFSWLPLSWGQPLQASIQQTFQNYFAAQALLAGFLSVAQATVFLVLGAPYAVLFGVSIGLTSLVPYASGITIILVSSLVALEDFSLGLKVLLAAIVVGQINDNVISPRLLGASIGLNPIWLIVALFIGGKVAGVLGLLVAVPIASVSKRMADIIRLQPSSQIEDIDYQSKSGEFVA